MGTPNRKPQEYGTNIIGMYLPGYLDSIRFLLYSWGSLAGVNIKVPFTTILVGSSRHPVTVLKRALSGGYYNS